MYNNNRYRNRTSIRYNSSGSGFSKSPYRNKYNTPRFSSNNKSGARRSQLEGANINMFIKKAAPTNASQADFVNTSFEYFNISQNLKLNIKNRGYDKPTPI